jgi:hypothetical protein
MKLTILLAAITAALLWPRKPQTVGGRIWAARQRRRWKGL